MSEVEIGLEVVSERKIRAKGSRSALEYLRQTYQLGGRCTRLGSWTDASPSSPSFFQLPHLILPLYD